ncbi:MAG: AraC family transcriptional regulator [Nocardiopsaceae bacterium]|nr:AraC family transcriptional regulator [Nocardiopsaceae bacterium]
METSDDRFASFVDWLARNMDDHATRGAGLAAEFFVSRTLLDRLVRAAAGEPTARFRRRLLLERAAFQVREGRWPVIDVAIGAGYSSGEAFARAFRRAYGSAPTTWRSAPHGIHLGPRSRVHFYPPGGLRFPATSVQTNAEETDMEFAAGLVDHHIAVLERMLSSAATLTDQQLDAPVEVPRPAIDQDPTIRSLLSRLVGQLQMWGAAMASRPYDFDAEQNETIASMHARLASAGQDFAAYVHGVCAEDRFGETFVDAAGDEPYVFTAAGMIAHVLTYAAFRRTLVVSALAGAGCEIEDDPLSWFAP